MTAVTRRGVLIAGALLAARPSFALAASESERLNEFFERVFRRQVARNPLFQARLGVKTDQDKWNDVSDARADEDAKLTRRDLAELRAFDYESLTPAAQLNHRLFAYDAGQELELFRWRHHRYPVCQMRGPQRTIPHTLINNHPIGTHEDAEAYVARLHGVKEYLAEIVAGLGRQEKLGVKPPRFAYPLVIGNCENLLRGTPWNAGSGDSPMLADFKAKIAAAGLNGQAALVRGAEAGLREGFGHGFRQLIDWLREAEARGAHESGVWSLPDGDDYYAAMLEAHTTLPATADEVHAIGLEEVARLHGEIERLMQGVGFNGGVGEFFEHLRTNRQFYYPNTDKGRADYIAAAEAVLAEIDSRLAELTTFRPEAGMIVKRVEPWLEESAGTAGYFSPSADGTRPGILYYNLRDMANLPRYGLSALAYHEGVPGHHLENAVSQELPLPAFRLYGGYTAYSEGWGLYAEELPKALGMYRDPWQDLGRLTSELMRAGRLVVDTGLHARRWTRERTIDWLNTNTADSHADNVTATHRYIVTPGQATAYEMGKLKMMELKGRAQSALGDRYRLRDFNDVVLGGGPVPMPVLEENVEAWLADV